jgi:hypothetical protein
MQTDILTRDERKLQIAAAVGTDHVAEVSLDIRRMRELGVLVDVDVHGTSMFTARATWNELGIPEEDTRRKRLKRGTKDLIPKVYIGRGEELTTEHLVEVARTMVSLATTMSAGIAQMREWAARARLASSRQQTGQKEESGGRALMM